MIFAELGLDGISRERLKKVGDIFGGPRSLCANHPFKATSEDIVNAMIAADALGRERQRPTEQTPEYLGKHAARSYPFRVIPTLHY